MPHELEVLDDVEGYEEEAQREGTKLGRQLGWWRAEGNVFDHSPSVEVSKFKCHQPISALGRYRLQKPSSDLLAWATRLHRPIVVDGMNALRFYCIWSEVDEPAYELSTYMTDGLAAWVIECWSSNSKIDELRPVFERIVLSFHRT